MSNSKVALITGVSSGIGRVAAELMAARGVRVFGTVRRLEKSAPIRGVELVEMDLRDDTSIDAAIESVIAKTGRIDVLVNNAGVGLVGAVEETSVAEAQTLFDANVMGILRVVHAVLPHMRNARSGRIVNVSSILGVLPAPYMGLYSASKHAVEGLSESLDHEVRQFGIRVSLVEPSFTKTNLESNSPRVTASIEDYATESAKALPTIAERILTAPGPQDVANTIVKAALGSWRMRHRPSGEAALLGFLRRFMPSAPVDSGIRKTFGLAK